MSLRVNLFDAAAGRPIDGDDVRRNDAARARRDFETGVLAAYRADADGGEIRCLLAATVDGERRPVVAQGRWSGDGYAGVPEPPWSNFERFVDSGLETNGWRVADDSLTRTVFRKLDNRALDPVAAGQSSLGGAVGDRPALVTTPSTPDAVAVFNHLVRTADGRPSSVVVTESDAGAFDPPSGVDVVVTSDPDASEPVVEPLPGAGTSGTPSDGTDPSATDPTRGAPGGVGRSRDDASTAPTGEPATGDDEFDLEALSGGDPFDGLTDDTERGGSTDPARGDADAGSPDPGSPRSPHAPDDVPRGAPDRTRRDEPDPASDVLGGGPDHTPREGSEPGDERRSADATPEERSGSTAPTDAHTGSGDTGGVDADPEPAGGGRGPADTDPEPAGGGRGSADTDPGPIGSGPDPTSAGRGPPDGDLGGDSADADGPARRAVSTESTGRGGPKLGLAPAASYELRLYETATGELALSTERDEPGVDERAVRAADHGVALAVDPARGRARGTVTAVRNGPETFLADFEASGAAPDELVETFVETVRATVDELGWRPAEGTTGPSLVFEHATDATPFEPDVPGEFAALLESGTADFGVPTHSKAVELFRWVRETVPRAGVVVADAGRTRETEWADVVIQPDDTADGVELVGEAAERVDRQALGDRTRQATDAFVTVVEAVAEEVRETGADDTHLEAFLAELLTQRLPEDHRFTITAPATTARRRAAAVGWATVAGAVAAAATLTLAALSGALDGLGAGAPLLGVGGLPAVPVGLQAVVCLAAVAVAAARPAGRHPALVGWLAAFRAWWRYPPVSEAAVFPGSGGTLLDTPGSGGTVPDRLAAVRRSYEASSDAPGSSYAAFVDAELLDAPALEPFSVADLGETRRRRLVAVGGSAVVGGVGGVVLGGAVVAAVGAAGATPGAAAGLTAWIAVLAAAVAVAFAVARRQGYGLGDLP
ncbi:hypothetical protein [Halobaculum sp. MBLA0143]|uniref:hypothetical protein n=1 Tax=Halobaculum sp. MBLA0143 TaxID=3079933 RepID=UPI0035262936